MTDERRSTGRLEVNPPNTSAPPPQDRPAPLAGERPAASDTSRPLILALLYLASVVVGITGLVAFVLALVWNGEAGEPWERTHYEYQIRTFLIWLGCAVAGCVFFLTIVGIPIAVLLWIGGQLWVLVRAVMALVQAGERRPMPNPQSLLI